MVSWKVEVWVELQVMVAPVLVEVALPPERTGHTFRR